MKREYPSKINDIWIKKDPKIWNVHHFCSLPLIGIMQYDATAPRFFCSCFEQLPRFQRISQLAKVYLFISSYNDAH